MLPGTRQQLLSVGNKSLPAPTALLIIAVLILLHIAPCLILGDCAGPLKRRQVSQLIEAVAKHPTPGGWMVAHGVL